MDYIALAKLVIELIKLLTAAFDKDKTLAMAADTPEHAKIKLALAADLEGLAKRIRKG